MYNDDFGYFKERLDTMSRFIQDSAGAMEILSTYDTVSKKDIDALEDIVNDIIKSTYNLEATIKTIKGF